MRLRASRAESGLPSHLARSAAQFDHLLRAHGACAQLATTAFHVLSGAVSYLGQHAAAVQAALAKDPAAAQALILNRALSEASADPSRTYAWPAFVASVARDRGQLLAILRLADQRKERWGDAGLVLHMERRWSNDAEVSRLLKARRLG